MAAIFFGSIGSVAETSDMQRRAFNEAFAEHGLDWTWEGDAYADMLRQSGGRDRIAAEAEERGETVDADAVHASKVAAFHRFITTEGLTPRPGVVEAIWAAKNADRPVAFVSTTDRETIDLILTALAQDLPESPFDLVIDRSRVARSKPHSDAYLMALDTLGLAPHEAMAVEDNPPGAEAARAAGIRVVAFPGLYHRDHDFGEVVARTEALDATLFGLSPGL